MLSFQQARQTILDHVTPLGVERVGLLDASERIVAEDIIAPWSLPVWDNSAMDGFAVRHDDCSNDGTLTISGYIPAGGYSNDPVQPGTAVRIMTGAPIPPGADTVVPFEETSEKGDQLTIRGSVTVGDHIRVKGEDITDGENILTAGSLLRPAEIGLLATFNKVIVPVYRRPRVAILATGDELIEPGTPPNNHQIVNCNSFAVAAALKEIGAEPILLGIARDNRESHLQKIKEGLKADALITSAGVSAGDRDLVRDILEELDVKSVFWKIDIKPGRPTAFAMYGDKPVFSLPGNPVSTMITFEEFVKPALLKMMGHRRVFHPTVRAILKDDVKKKSGRTQFMRVFVTMQNGQYLASTSGDQNTGILKTMIRANGLAILPAAPDHIGSGAQVDVQLIGGDYV
ncbi:molybdopterin molybdotransferase MoeA [Desulfuromonas acetoxidans]|uniref:Molybdopterin molybdenumtransferase n=1 Tax=Desulfuromonas acetoxidans (strain DSM 684 / 11070) TaxID=281689 RepID=Q1JZK9_DESA6|nr:gephyrin-like molybdotransferase Glp [Desulfuromonas acetoxidans]EAT15558.1 MoeA-like, domain I and II [Desulfuromonas acetoxidans DSM 684]MBF0646073.1 molybdopterin molybdotransferase MoeA [Desulfuromonas acetoxidans]NVD25149.1 molybdopterin molybdotransferase MoeA [Desulfuromonas acetoxidans]NVE17229.1 molybdopterin molybdotransferase MoeA [Desulfuromonas acetoxidans]